MNGPVFLSFAVPTLVAYLLGALPFGYWFVRLRSGRDIRGMGSGNIGATNVHRTMGSSAGIVVLLLDILKGLAAVWIAGMATHKDPIALGFAAVAVMIGHCYPVFLRFKGGKAVATFIGAFGYIAPLALLICAAFFVAIVAVTRFISLGSLLAVFAFPFAFDFINRPPAALLVASILAAVLIIYRHRANIARLRTGTEHAFSLKGKAV